MRPKLGKNNQQWIFDYTIRTTGKTAHWELDALLDRLPVEVRSWDMIPKVLGKHAAREEEFGRKAEEAGHFRTAWEAYSRACQTYFNAQHVICEDDNPEKIRLYQKLLHCHEKVRTAPKVARRELSAHVSAGLFCELGRPGIVGAVKLFTGFLNGFSLPGADLRGNFDNDAHVQIAASGAADRWHPFSAKAEDGPRLRACRNLDLGFSADRRDNGASAGQGQSERLRSS